MKNNRFISRFLRCALLLATAFFPLRQVLAEPAAIQPGEHRLDDRDKHLQARGGGITKIGDTYSCCGDDRSPPTAAACRRSRTFRGQTNL